MSCFQHPAPEYPPDNFRSPADVANPLEAPAENSYGKSLCVAGRRHLRKKARNVTSLGGVVRNTLENQPYTAVTIAWGLGWLLGRAQRSL